MTGLVRVALWVRRGTWSVLFVGAVLALGLSLFQAGRYSVGDRELTVTPSSAPDPLAQVVASVEAQGLSCTGTPSLAPSVVFERLDGTVEVVTFDQAMVGSQNGTGWVRRYCLPMP